MILMILILLYNYCKYYFLLYVTLFIIIISILFKNVTFYTFPISNISLCPVKKNFSFYAPFTFQYNSVKVILSPYLVRSLLQL